MTVRRRVTIQSLDPFMVETLLDALSQYDENSEDVYEELSVQDQARVDTARILLKSIEAAFVEDVQ